MDRARQPGGRQRWDFTATRVGAVQSVSASEALPPAVRVYEAWLRRSFAGDRAAIKAGLIDINTTFDVQETAALFLNASHASART